MNQIKRGKFDGIKHNHMVGWAVDAAGQPAEIMTMIDGECVGFARADQYRQDLEKAGIAEGRCAFRIAVPDQYIDGRPHKIELWVDNGEHRIGQPLDFTANITAARPDATHAPHASKQSENVADMGTSASAATVPIASIAKNTAASLSALGALYPQSPYYDRLRHAARGSTRLEALEQINETLARIDRPREGHMPKAPHLVSIVMPAHNREDLIRHAIRSVLAQSYRNFELLVCDDASHDDTASVVESFKDPRITLIRQTPQQGAAVARNACLKVARGDFIAYLDSDNIWHPRYLEMMVEELRNWPGNMAAYAGYFDLDIDGSTIKIRKAQVKRFHLEHHIDTPYIDLNSFFHRRGLYDVLGGFDERLKRRQDYDLIIRYCWVREPRVVPHVMNLYQRIAEAEQITRKQRDDTVSPQLVADKVASFYKHGMPVTLPPWVKKVSVLSWDMSRNHFAKAYSVAEALSRHVEVELISYRFFEDPIFPPLAGRTPPFTCKYLDGADFPDFFKGFAQGVEAITGDVIYAVKPRLTSLGLALMANYHTGKPIMLECNDLETVVQNAKGSDSHRQVSLDAIVNAGEEALVPHAQLWSEILDPLVTELPVVFTHNINLNLHYDRRCLFMRNIKNETEFDPANMDRDAIRAELGLSPDDRVILFGGLVRRHKGIFQLLDLLKALDDPRYKLLIIGSRDTPDLRTLSATEHDNVIILPPQPPEKMAAVNLASDLIVLWLDPKVPAGQYQSPYKMSDALAMGPTIIASPTSDLGDFAARGLVLNVAFGNEKKLVAAIRQVFDDPEETAKRRALCRRFFEREFSYNAVLPAFALGASQLEPNKVYPVSERFAEAFSAYRKQLGSMASA